MSRRCSGVKTIGFMVVEEIARRHNFPPFREKFKGLVSEGSIAGEKVLILKPQTWMNSSGDTSPPS